MIHPPISLEVLACRPLLGSDLVREPARDIAPLFGIPTQLEMGRCEDVLYIPDMRLQLCQDRWVPQEANAEPWTVEFEKERRFLGRANRYEKPFEFQRLDLDVCILSNFYSQNFFHWLTEEMMKVAILERASFDGSYIVHGLPDFALEFLLMVGIAPHRVLGDLPGPTRFRTATLTTSVHAFNLLEYEPVFQAVRSALRAAAPSPVRGGRRRIWIDRREGVNNLGRDLANVEEIYQLLGRYGVEVVDLAALSIGEQITTVAGCEVLAGVHGAGFVHSMFLDPGRTVIECFSPLYVNPSIFDICRVLRHRHHMLVYEHAYHGYPYGNQVKVNPAQLDLAFRTLAT